MRLYMVLQLISSGMASVEQLLAKLSKETSPSVIEGLVNKSLLMQAQILKE